MAAGSKLMAKYGGSKDPTYSAVYYPGRYWHAAMSFVYDFGGQIAKTKSGKWVGTLDSPQSLQGLIAWRTMVLKLSKANKTGDENKPQQALVFAKGKVGSIIANGWEWGYALDPKVGNPALTGKIGAYPMPSHTKGQYMPTFLGGSVLGIPVTSKEKALATDWIAAFTSSSQHDHDGRQGRHHPEHDHAREDQRLQADARPVRRGREGKLVRAGDAELGERRERERAPDLAQRHAPEPRQDEGAREAGERPHHADPERLVVSSRLRT